MHHARPLPDTHPEFTVIHWPGFTEYRVENWRLARDGSARVVHGTHVWSWLDIAVVVGVVVLTRIKVHVARSVLFVVIGIVLTCLVWTRFTQVLHESILVFPTLGIQLETHRGHPLLPVSLLITHHFVPRSALEDVVVHEGFRRWDVRFYLAVLRQRRSAGGGRSRVEVRVAFENILPYFPVLNVVYLGVHETLFPPPTWVVETADDQ